MKKLVCILSLMLMGISAYCQHRVVQKLGDTAEITFPDTPRLVKQDGLLYACKDSANNIYIAQYSKLDKPAGNSIYDNYIKGVISPRNATLFYRTPVTVQGLAGVSFGYKMNVKGNNYYCYHHVFYIDTAVLSYCLWSKDSLAQDDKRIKAYFGSFKLLIKPGLNYNASTRLAYKFGEVLGVFIIVAFIVGIIVLIIYLVVRARKKRNTPPTTREYDGP